MHAGIAFCVNRRKPEERWEENKVIEEASTKINFSTKHETTKLLGPKTQFNFNVQRSRYILDDDRGITPEINGNNGDINGK